MYLIAKGSRILLCALVIIILNTLDSSAQTQPTTNEADTLYRIETNDGNVFIGKIIEMDLDKIILQSEAIGTITLYRKFIVKIEKMVGPEMTSGELWYRHLQSARYFFAPNGYGLKKGESYYQNIWVFYNQYSVGVSEHFSIGFGMIPLFFFDFSPTPIWITPKFSVPIVKEKINLGAGALLGYVIGQEGNAFGIVFGSATFGPHDKNVTLGVGYAFAGGEFTSTPIINIGGLLRVSRNSYLMTENYIITSGGQVGGVSIMGARSMINKSAIDYGLAFPFAPDMGGFIALPWLGLTIPFKKQ